ncbi:MAG: hypothetical protein MJZ24_04630 [Paludibacteraceae bacterium]|nr:hypothetical protein [Paludibacteraceae bacterium]
MDFGKLFDTAKKVWDNGGKDIAMNFIFEKASQTSKQNEQTQVTNKAALTSEVSVPADNSNPPAEPLKKEVATENGIMKVHDDMTNDEEDQFIESLQNGFCNVSATNPKEAMAALKVFATATKETIKFVKLQEVKRERIVAEKDAKIAQIEATKEILKEYLDKTFDERKDTFSKYFAVVDMALENGNNEALAQALENINSLAASSPFKDLSNMNTFKEIMNNSDEELDI